MKFSKRLKSMQASPIRKLAPFAAQAKADGVKVYHLNIGQPDIKTPECFFNAVKNFNEPVLEYAGSQGIPELIEALQKYYETYDMHFSKDDFIVTNGGSEGLFFTYKKTRFILQILYKNATYYLLYLRRINKLTIEIEREIHNSMKNKELLQLLELEKSLIYFSTSLKSIELVLQKLLRTSAIKKYPEDEDLLEDVIIENKQAVEMATIYGDILSRIMDAFSAIINNNQNNVMQFLTVVTFIFSIPTIVSGFFGMNVINLPFENDPYGFWIILLITTVICLILTVLLSKNKLL